MPGPPIRPPDEPLQDSQLPLFPPGMPTVMLYREQLERFRADYEIMLRFAAAVAGVDPERLNLVEMERTRMRLGLPAEDPIAAAWVRGINPVG